jgi:Asp/Glu/hydantoin racemase
VRIWYQLVSSESGRGPFLSTLQKLCDGASAPGTTVEVRGTQHGALGDQLRIVYHYDVREIIDNGLRLRRSGGYDAFVIANSLDGALVELREILDIPVLSFMDVACAVASQMGEKVGVLSPYARMSPRYREVSCGYLPAEKLASVESVMPEAVPGFRDAFASPEAGDRAIEQIFAAGRRALDKGADVLIPAGPAAALLAHRGIFELDGAPLLDVYRLLVKYAEMMVAMQKLTGVHVSRRQMYQKPEAATLAQIADARGIDLLREP